MLGSLLLGGASAGLGFLSNYLNGLMNTGFQKELQDHAAATNYKYAEKSARNTPTWNRAGLESAGYNPMLAVQNAIGGANAGWTSTGQASSGTENLSTAIANAQSYQRLQNETKTAEATAENQHEQALTEESKRKNFEFDSMMKDAQKHMIDKETSWIDKKKNAEIYRDMQEAEQARAVASVQAYNAETARISSQAQHMNAITNRDLGNIERDSARYESEWRKRHPIQAGWNAGISNYSKSIGAFMRKR